MSYAAKCDVCGGTAEVDGRQACNGELPAGWACVYWESSTDFCDVCVNAFRGWLSLQREKAMYVIEHGTNDWWRGNYWAAAQHISSMVEKTPEETA